MKKLQKTVVAIALAITIITISVPAIAAEPSPWAIEQVTAAINLNLVPQSLQSSYTQAITRVEFCVLAVILYETFNGEITGRLTFSDTNDVNVEKAASIGIIQGVGNNQFSPHTSLTREQAAVILSNLMERMVEQLPWMLPSFADNASISSWAVFGVGLVQATGIMTGTGENNFSPGGSYTREQSIITIMRAYDVITGTASYPQIPAPPPVDNSLPISDSLRRGMTSEEFDQAYDIAYGLVSQYASFNEEIRIAAVFNELSYMRHYSPWVYSMTERHYNNVYGFFVLNRTSCAGDVRAAALCLTILGVPYEHVNENQNAHQWVRVQLGERYLIIDINAGWSGYESVPYQHPLMG